MVKVHNALFTNTHAKVNGAEVNVQYLLEISRCSYRSNIKPSPFSGDEQNRHESDEYRDEAIKQIIHVRISNKRGQRNNDKRTDCLQAATNVN